MYLAPGKPAGSIWTTPKSSLGTGPVGIDSWSRRFNLMVIRDSHRPIVDSYLPAHLVGDITKDVV